MTLELPAGLRELLAALRAAGGRPYLVGGAVRDALLGLPVKDYDVEVFDLPLEGLERVLAEAGRVDAVGQAFRVFKLSGVPGVPGAVDVTLPRRDSKVAAGHRGIAVAGDPTLTVEEAARRRDFTINAMLFDPASEALLDPWNGRADLEARLLRAVDARTFGEDPLRALRAVQFAARYELGVDPATAELCASMPIRELPAERVFGEIEKLLLKAPSALARPGAAEGLGDAGRARPGAAAARGDSPGPGLASGRRRVGAHAAGGRRSGHARRRSGGGPAAPARRHARGALSRPRQGHDDALRGGPDPLARARRGRHRADHRAARSLAGSQPARLRRTRAGAGSRRAAPQARPALRRARARGRRGDSQAGAQVRARPALPCGEGRLPGPASRALRGGGHGLVPRASAPARRRQAPAAADPPGPRPAGPRPRPGAGARPCAAGRLREAARRRRDDARGSPAEARRLLAE